MKIRFHKTFAACFMVLALFLTCFAALSPIDVEAATIKLSATKKTLYKPADGRIDYVLTLKGVSAKNGKNIKWSSSNTDVIDFYGDSSLSANQAGVYASDIGKAKVTATYKGKKYTCTFTVKAEETPKDLTLTLNAGDTYKLAVKTSRDIKYTSYTPGVAAVSSSGVITAVAPGYAQIQIDLGYDHYFVTVYVNSADTLPAGTVRFVYKDGKTVDAVIGDAPIALEEGVEYVYYGTYPQSCVYGDALTKDIIDAKYDELGYATVNGISYRRIGENDRMNGNIKWEYIKHTGQIIPWSGIEITDSADRWRESEYYYFRFDPIKWKVLEDENCKLTLISDIILDAAVFHRTIGYEKDQYDAKYTGLAAAYYAGYYSTWEKSTVRSWLNSYDASENNMMADYSAGNRGFLNCALTTDEQKLLVENSVASAQSVDIPVRDYSALTKTTSVSKVWLPSMADVTNTDYGFGTYTAATTVDYNFSTEGGADLKSRIAAASEYAIALGIRTGGTLNINGQDEVCEVNGIPSYCYMLRDCYRSEYLFDSNAYAQRSFYVTSMGYFSSYDYGAACGKAYASGTRPMIQLDITSLVSR